MIHDIRFFLLIHLADSYVQMSMAKYADLPDPYLLANLMI